MDRDVSDTNRFDPARLNPDHPESIFHHLEPGDQGRWLRIYSAFMYDQGDFAQAEKMVRARIAQDPTDPDAWFLLSLIQVALEQKEAAIDSLKTGLEIDPNNKGAKHRLAALTGAEEDEGRAPQDLITDAFDAYAETFDTHLMDHLKYEGPKLVRKAWLAARGPTAKPVPLLLDLACGTGLVGVEMRPMTEHLAGVDLSMAMLQKAGKRQLYDELFKADIVDCLKAINDGSLPAAVAADALIYLGDLSPFMTELGRALTPGGLAILTTERLDPKEPGQDQGWHLRETGRYAHATGYLQRLAGASGMTVLRVTDEVLRVEKETPIKGDLITLVKVA